MSWWTQEENAIVEYGLRTREPHERLRDVAERLVFFLPDRTPKGIKNRLSDYQVRAREKRKEDSHVQDSHQANEPPIADDIPRPPTPEQHQPATENEIIAQLDRDNAKLRASLSQKETRIRAQAMNSFTLDDIVSSMREFIVPYPVTPTTPARGNGRIPVDVVSMIGDWHTGEVIDPKNVKWKNAYNSDIMVARAWDWVTELMDRVIGMGSRYTADTLTLTAVGDMAAGDIHMELAKTSDLTPPKAAMLVSDIIAQSIILLFGVFRFIKFLSVPGNHERLSEKIEHKLPENSWAMIINEMVRLRLSEYESAGRFISYPCDSWERHVKLELSKTWLNLQHGDRKTSGAANEHTQEDVHAAQEILDEYYGDGSDSSIDGYKFIGFLMGHTHRKYAQLRLPYRFACGSLPGRCEFGDKVRKKIRIEHPSQFTLIFGEGGHLLDLWDIEPGRGYPMHVPPGHGFTIRYPDGSEITE